MALILLVAFIVTPIVEIAVFIEVGGVIGLWSTLAIVIATAAAGTWLLRLQGLSTLRRAQDSMARNELPLHEVFDGLCLLVAGLLLLTPGFVTDAIGLALFVPPFRRALRSALHRWLVRSGRIDVVFDDHGPRDPDGRQGPVIEGEYEDLTRRSGRSIDGSRKRDR